jgi:hypothetical protein
MRASRATWRHARAAPRFIAHFTVEEDGDFVTVAVFCTEQDFATFSNAEATWIAEHLVDLMPASR